MPKQFAPDAATLRAVRAFVCQKADVAISHPAVLVASELASNAIAHTRRAFTVRVRANPVIRIEVVDSKPNLPAQPTVSATGETGHGLTIVDKLSERWGTIVEADTKTVWAEVAA